MRQVTIEAIVEISYTPGEHLNYNASPGARTRTQTYDQFSAGVRTRHNRNGSISTTTLPRFTATLRCSDEKTYELNMAELVPRRRLTEGIRDAVIGDVRENIVGMPLQLNDTNEIDYQELRNTLRARKAASTTE